MIHQSDHVNPLAGQEINKGFVQGGFFGLPQDVVINTDGRFDFSPRWTRAGNANQYATNVAMRTVFDYPIHDISDSCANENMNYIAMHILVVGDFDSNYPTIAQLGSLGKLISYVSRFLPNFKDVVYHNDFVAISCPGANFPPVQFWRTYFVSQS
jgi:hypothetical protein